jgi:uncharacterized protein (TIGR04255 family)
MPFPKSQRVLYSKNPLNEVICQLRFPTILRIDAELPTEFQERIREEYPTYQVNQPKPPESLANLMQIVPEITAQVVGNKTHQFIGEEGKWKIGLNRDFLSISTAAYQHWESFKSRLMEASEALQTIYRPSYFGRIGLRYQNLICRSRLGLQGIPWSELLQPHISGALALTEIEDTVTGLTGRIIFDLGKVQGHLLVQYGLARVDESEEICFLIDADYYTEKRTELNNGFEILDQLHQHSGNFFRWCITDQLHEAMDPRPIGA